MPLINLGVKALLSWVNNITSTHREINIEELQDGELLLRIIYKLKNEPNPPLTNSTEERFNLIEEFVEKDCRFSPTKGTPLSWDNIRNGINLTVEIAKVVLLLFYHDMMSGRCTLKTLDWEVEREIANLTDSFVMESDGCVYLRSSLDAYLAKRNLPVTDEILARMTSTSSSGASTVSSLSDEESPVFHRIKKISFVEMHTVASSSVSKSPLQDLMTTPKFQLRRIQGQMIQEREYRDGLERELTSKISLIAQNESHINQLQYRLDKMKREQSDQEHSTREQINELETKNCSLQQRLNEILKENKDCKNNCSLMERKVCELEEENGVLSSQMRTAYAQLSIFEAEVRRLTETQAAGQEEWRARIDDLQSELNQATAEKELLTEQIQILQGKLSCLEDEIRAARKKDVGENMGPVIERDELEREIDHLKNELNSTFGCLKKAEANVEAKMLQLSAYEQEIAQQKELMEQQNLHIEDIARAKDLILKELEKEMSEQRAALQKEIDHLKFQLEQAEQQRAQQISELQNHIATLQQELDILKETSREKEYLLNQTKENMKVLEAKFHDLASSLVEKDHQINVLKEEVDVFTSETMKNKNEIKTKDQLLAQLRLENSNQQDVLQNRIQTLTVEVENLMLSVQRAEQEVQLKRDLLTKTEQENIKQREALQQQIIASEDEACRLSTEIEARNEQLVILQKDSSKQSENLQEELNHLKFQLEQTEQQKAQQIRELQNLNATLQQELDTLKETSREKECLLNQTKEQLKVLETKFHDLTSNLVDKDQQINFLKEEVKGCTVETLKNKNDIETKDQLLAQLCLEHSNQQDILQNTIQSLTVEVENLTSSVQSAKQEIQLKHDLSKEIEARNEQLVILQKDSSKQAEILQEQINHLKGQVECLNNSLTKAEDQVQSLQDLLAKQEQESAGQKDLLQQQLTVSEESVRTMKEHIQTKEDYITSLNKQFSEKSELVHQDIQNLEEQVESLSSSLKNAEENLKSKESLFAKQHSESTLQIETLQTQMVSSQQEVSKLTSKLHSKEEQLSLIVTESSMQSERNDGLDKQLQSMNDSLRIAKDQVKAKEDIVTNLDKNYTFHMEALKKQNMELAEEEAKQSKQSEVLQEQINHLKGQVECLNNSLTKAEDQVQSLQDLLVKREQESAGQKDLLQQQLTVSEESVRTTKEHIQTKEDYITSLNKQFSEKSELVHQDIQSLEEQVESLSSSLKNAEENLKSKDSLFAKQHSESTLQIETLQTQMVSSQQEVSKLTSKLHAKEEQLSLIVTESSMQSERIDGLDKQLQSMNDSLRIAKDQVKAKENIIANLEKKNTFHMEALKKQNMELVEEAKQSEVLQEQINHLKGQVEGLNNSLTKAEDQVQSLQDLLAKQEQESAGQKDLLQQQLTVSEQSVRTTKEHIQTKEDYITSLNKQFSEKSELVHQDIQSLEEQVKSLSSSLKNAEENLKSKDSLFAKQHSESTLQIETLQTQMVSSQQEVSKLTSKLHAKEEQLSLIVTESSMQSERNDGLDKQLQSMNDSLRIAKDQVKAKEDLIVNLEKNYTFHMEALKKQNMELVEEAKQFKKEIQTKEDNLDLFKVESSKQSEVLKNEIEGLKSQIQSVTESLQTTEEQVQAKVNLVANKEMEISKERNKYHSLTESSSEELTMLRLRMQAQEQQVATLKEEGSLQSDLLYKEIRQLKDQLALANNLLCGAEQAKTEAVEHYKTQMEKAVSHYNNKKQLLQDSQEEVAKLKHSLEERDGEVKATSMELKLLQLELEKAQSQEKNMLSKLTRLEAQVASVDLNSCAHNRVPGHEAGTSESCCLQVPGSHSHVHTKAEPKRVMSTDSLDQSSLEDSLNNTRKLSAPDESSTPLVRSSERLAAKNRGLKAESLETLYFTPINTRHIDRTTTEDITEVDFRCINPSSSIKRRRTTQVINITMTKKTPGGVETDETFYSLASARSQPDLSGARPVSMELFDTPAKMAGAANDQLIGLPGYRRSAIHSQPTSTFCVGAENEPDAASDDWMRIAELQARNKACPPHLKSSYRLEFETGFKSIFAFTDEDVRTGDPTETIRRASVMPGQLQDSLASHRHSLAAGQSSATASIRSHRLSLMADYPASKSVSSSQLKCTKRSTSTLSVPPMSPEKKLKASCFPRPLTPKNKNSGSRPSNSQLHPALSPAERRQSMMFSIENTPKNSRSSNYLKKGLNKLRNSSRKSPGKTSKTSPVNAVGKAATSRAAASRAGKEGSFKSPQTANKSAKSPRLTASARKKSVCNNDENLP
ncbi:nuclear mitotic apparatus protein 1 isoform X1 [Vanacampus margaritifer]